jgi:hypothetical protein
MTITDNSMLVFNIDLMACFSKLAYDSVSITDNKKVLLIKDTYRAGIPISLEYHSGADVLLNRNAKTMYTLGAGIAPSHIATDDYYLQSPIIFTPFIKAELGMFVGLSFKIRLMYYIGQLNYEYAEDYNLLGGKNYMVSDFKAGAGYNISLVIMPFSYMWDR